VGAAGHGKKRIRRLAEWHFGGGDAGARYCDQICEWRTNGRCQADPEAEDEDARKGCHYVAYEPKTEAGEEVWEVISDCAGQLRVAGFGKPFALDFGAIMLIGNARDVDSALLSETIPLVEMAVVASTAGDDPGVEE